MTLWTFFDCSYPCDQQQHALLPGQLVELAEDRGALRLIMLDLSVACVFDV